MEKNESMLFYSSCCFNFSSFWSPASSGYRHSSTSGRVHAGLGQGSLKMALRLHVANPIYENGVPKVAVDTTQLGLDGLAPWVKLGKLRAWKEGPPGCKHCLFLPNRVLPPQIFFHRYHGRHNTKIRVLTEWICRRKGTMSGDLCHNEHGVAT